MELQLFNFTAVFILLLSTILLRAWRMKKVAIGRPLNLPPGPRKLPIVGNILHLVGSHPHRRLKDLANMYGPSMHLQLGETATIVVSSPEVAKEIIKTHDLCFAQRPFVLAFSIATYGCQDVAFSPYGEYWRQVRKICTKELLTAKRVQSFQSIREEEALNLVSSISSCDGSKDGVNLSELFFSSSCSLTAKSAFGKRCKDQKAFLRCIKKVLTMSGGFSICDLFPSAKWLHVISGAKPKIEKLHRELDMIFESIISERKARNAATERNEPSEKKACLIDVLLALQDSGELEFTLTTTSIKAVILDMFTGGSETAATTLEWAMSELLTNPTALEKAQTEVRHVFDAKGKVDEADINDLAYLKAIIQETLRMHPPLALIPRECREQCQINGHDIPVKAKVLVNLWAIGNDSNNWSEAEKFYPERFLEKSFDYKGSHFEFLPFGGGRRICAGISFGLATIHLFLAHLLYYFDWKLPPGLNYEDLDMAEEFGITVKRKNPLVLVPLPTRPLALE